MLPASVLAPSTKNICILKYNYYLCHAVKVSGDLKPPKNVKDFTTFFSLDHKIAVFVPGAIHDKSSHELQEKKTAEVIKAFSGMFGGCTVNHVTGGWYSQQINAVIAENINICYSYCTSDQIRKNAAGVILHTLSTRPGLYSFVIREICLNEWSSTHEVRKYKTLPAKYVRLLNA